MKAYSYLKTPPGKGRLFIKKKIFLMGLRKSSPVFFVLTGLSLIAFVSYYLVSYKVLVFKKAREKILAPISEITVAEVQSFMKPLVAGAFTQQPKALIKNGELDFDMIANWFPTASVPQVLPSKITHYTISIPKLKIEDGVVEIGGTEIKKTLVQYPGTALPGEYGNVVIFGHSILPLFYNPKDYKSIFSLLPTLDQGDQIYVYFDGIEYVYEVVTYKEVKPEEIDVLEQHLDQQALSLITCVPPGTYLKRGVVTARLVKK